MADIKIKATPRSAYNPQRTPNALLLNQARELEKAVIAHGRSVRKRKPKTEEQVAAYMRHLNRALHQQIVLPNMKRRPVDVPLDELFPSKATKKTKGPASGRRKPSTSISRKKKPARSAKTRRRS
jgi:hypothetical protein